MKFLSNVTFSAENADSAGNVIKALKSLLVKMGVDATFTAPVDAFSTAETVTIFTDGGAKASADNLGGWACIIEKADGTVIEQSGGVVNTTNNRMEMLAVIKALEQVEMGAPIVVVADSEYVIKGCTAWARNWKRNGWRTFAGEPVKNKDLWETLLALYSLHNIKFQHVKGHTGHPQNERCDQLCTEAMAAVNKAMLAGQPFEIDPFGPNPNVTA